MLNQAIYEAPLFVDKGPLQISATAFVKSIVIEAPPLVTTISAGTTTIRPGEEEKPPVIVTPPTIITPPEEFQKPDDFITDVQCPLGTSLVNGKNRGISLKYFKYYLTYDYLNKLLHSFANRYYPPF